MTIEALPDDDDIDPAVWAALANAKPEPIEKILAVIAFCGALVSLIWVLNKWWCAC